MLNQGSSWCWHTHLPVLSSSAEVSSQFLSSYLEEGGKFAFALCHTLPPGESLHYSDHLYGYCIPSLIRQFCKFSSNVYKGILDGVGWLLNKLYQPIFIGGRQRQTVHGVDAHIKSFGSLELKMNLSCSCLLCCYLFRLIHCSPILSHLSTLSHFISGEVDPRC